MGPTNNAQCAPKCFIFLDFYLLTWDLEHDGHKYTGSQQQHPWADLIHSFHGKMKLTQHYYGGGLDVFWVRINDLASKLMPGSVPPTYLYHSRCLFGDPMCGVRVWLMISLSLSIKQRLIPTTSKFSYWRKLTKILPA